MESTRDGLIISIFFSLRFLLAICLALFLACTQVHTRTRTQTYTPGQQKQKRWAFNVEEFYRSSDVCLLMCCIVLQGVAVCCSVLQYLAACCSVLQCVAVCHSMLHLYNVEGFDSARNLSSAQKGRCITRLHFQILRHCV